MASSPRRSTRKRSILGSETCVVTAMGSRQVASVCNRIGGGYEQSGGGTSREATQRKYAPYGLDAKGSPPVITTLKQTDSKRRDNRILCIPIEEDERGHRQDDEAQCIPPSSAVPKKTPDVGGSSFMAGTALRLLRMMRDPTAKCYVRLPKTCCAPPFHPQKDTCPRSEPQVQREKCGPQVNTRGRS